MLTRMVSEVARKNAYRVGELIQSGVVPKTLNDDDGAAIGSVPSTSARLLPLVTAHLRVRACMLLKRMTWRE
jgi:hypothetical protein